LAALIALFVISVVYVIWILWLLHHSRKLSKPVVLSENEAPGVSIIIPYRNEAQNIAKCILNLGVEIKHSAEVEVICVNDHSEDRSVEIVNELMLKYPFIRSLSLDEGNGKKSSLTKGIGESIYPWIITLDADTFVRPGWFSSVLAKASNSDCDMIVLPVDYTEPESFTDIFLNLEFLSLAGSGLASAAGHKPFMANGANFAFTKALFEELGGYTEHENISSGDDQFLLFKALKARPGTVSYLFRENVIADTVPPETIKDWFSQRVRWGSKARAYTSTYAIFVASIVFLINASLVGVLIWSVFNPEKLYTFLALFVIKLLADGVFLFAVCRLFGKLRLMSAYPILAMAYPFLLVCTALASLVWKPQWKGRRIRV
jgi:cellulose synthase/poly-beta-1,6-N-acetylglucosamine synthase-like glycosyltransferase